MNLKNNIIFVMMTLNISVFAQKLETGIYEVIYDVDSTFVNQNTFKVNPQDSYNNIKSDIIKVVIDRKNPKKYMVDLLFCRKLLSKTQEY